MIEKPLQSEQPPVIDPVVSLGELGITGAVEVQPLAQPEHGGSVIDASPVRIVTTKNGEEMHFVQLPPGHIILDGKKLRDRYRNTL
jgi:hypothetical protein